MRWWEFIGLRAKMYSFIMEPKTTLSPYDDKRYILKDGHYNIPVCK